MRGLKPRLQSSWRRDDGATAVLIGISLIVLFGAGALVLDVGNMFWERRQLQNGADGGSLAVAQDIARMIADGQPPPSTGPLGTPFVSTAEHYADSNSHEGEAKVEVPTPRLDTIDGRPLTDVGKVTVDTLVSDGQLSHWLAPVLGIDSSPVRATASAVYGPLVAKGAFPFAGCEELWQSNRPPNPSPGLLEIHYKGTGGQPPDDYGCEVDGNFPTGDNPGNFGWLETDGECVTEYQWSEGSGEADSSDNAGTVYPNPDCQDDVKDIEQAIADYKDGLTSELPIRIIPIFSEVHGGGANATYALTRFAAFEFSGISMEGNVDEVVGEWIEEPHCSDKQHRCVKGRFVKEVAPGSVDLDIGESDTFGVKLVE